MAPRKRKSKVSEKDTSVERRSKRVKVGQKFKSPAAPELSRRGKTKAVKKTGDKQEKCLMDAVKSADCITLNQIIDNWQGSNLSDTLCSGDYLYHAILQGNLIIVQTLVLHGASVVDQQNKNLLLAAIKNGHVDIVQFLFSLDFFEGSVNATDELGNSALILCQSLSASVDLTERLLDKGVQVNHQNNAGETALMKALEYRNFRNVVQLIRSGAHVQSNGFSLPIFQKYERFLKCALRNENMDVLYRDAIATNDVEYLKSVLLADQWAGSTSNRVSYALWHILGKIAANSDVDLSIRSNVCTGTEMQMIELLLNAGAVINFRLQGHTALYLACLLGDVGLVKFLLQRRRCKKNLDVLTVQDILTMIAMNDELSAILDVLSPYVKSLFKSHVCDPNRFQDSLKTAIRSKSEQVTCKLMDLLKYSYDRDFNFAQALDCAAATGDFSIFKTVVIARPRKFQKIISRPDKATKLLRNACLGDSLTIVEHVLQSWVTAKQAKSIDDSQSHPLDSVKSGEVAEMLFKYGDRICGLEANILKTSVGKSSLLNAVKQGSTNVIKVLFKHEVKLSPSILLEIHALCKEHGHHISSICSHLPVDYHLQDGCLSQILVSAVKTNDLDFVKWLVSKGANVNFEMYEQTPLSVSVNGNKVNFSIFQFLLDKGAQVDEMKRDEMLIKAVKNTTWETIDRFDICHSLIETGANVNANSGRPLLDHLLLRRAKEREPHLIRLLAENGADISADAACAVHRSIVLDEHYILYTLVHEAGCSPTLYDHGRFCLLHFRFFYESTISPLYMALLCGNVKLAREMVSMFYVTTSDLTVMPHNLNLRSHLKNNGLVKSLAYLKELGSSAPSLMQLSFAKVSELIGPSPCRKERVKQLNLPETLKRSLRFEPSEDEYIGFSVYGEDKYNPNEDVTDKDGLIQQILSPHYISYMS